MQEEKKGGRGDLGTMYRDVWYQTGLPWERRVQNTGATCLESPTFRESGGGDQTERAEGKSLMMCHGSQERGKSR